MCQDDCTLVLIKRLQPVVLRSHDSCSYICCLAVENRDYGLKYLSKFMHMMPNSLCALVRMPQYRIEFFMSYVMDNYDTVCYMSQHNL